ncbi:methylthioribulose 1-phosphate dehydratase [Stutzerimonas balearica]|uniref:Methylthioribulose-1-phosphate dehydratase n=1 Tax=Stutzerimonas balearica TaxID=74829 RepID=A0A9X7YRP2_9GAMM|nr:methylthioribulose 1-phosphate dehydratase [Stutzerimonas balearica]QQN51713.1 methylthioribulose 1-phosphate dehydratase [Stutzerimonas balearica]
MTATRDQLTRAIIEAGRSIHARGWSPAATGNYSARLTSAEVLLTVSGSHKGRLGADDLVAVDMQGASLEPGKQPSTDTSLHTQLYRWKPEIGAVLHTHSVSATVLSRIATGDSLLFADDELLKAFAGVTTHACQVRVPVLENDPSITGLAAAVQPWLQAHPDCAGYLIRGHGLYSWGATLSDALRQVEAFEFLFECELKMRALQQH